MQHAAGSTRQLNAPLLGAAALILLTLAAVAVIRWGGDLTRGASSAAAAAAAPRIVAERYLRFVDRSDGGVDVIDARTPERSEVLAPGSDGFLRATLRTFARERKRQGFDAEPPFRLSARTDGRLILEDPSTGRQVDLEAFGPSNSSRFARLLSPAFAPTAAATRTIAGTKPQAGPTTPMETPR